jgi:glycine hydroxymethyltransferase
VSAKNPYDNDVNQLIEQENKRQKESINLTASENYASKAVLQAQGSVLTNKYAEGYPGHRYYSGCSYIDQIESLAIERAKKLFKADHANVQPHSGSQANMAVYFALLKPGDTVLGMMLNQGGHLTHGAKANFSGKFYNFFSYGLNKETELLDYDEVERLAKENKPKIIVAGASSYPRTIDFDRFSRIAKEVGAYLMVDIAHIAGFCAVGLHPNPVPVADVVTTSTHKTLRGPRHGLILCKEEYASKINSAVFPMMQGGPQMHAIAAKAIAFNEALQPEFAVYMKNVLENAVVLAQELKNAGFRLVTGGTDNHIVLVDLTSKNINGLEAQNALEEAGIFINRNAIPFDTRPPAITSGIRLGTPAITSRGIGTKEMKVVASLIIKVLSDINNTQSKKQVKDQIKDICLKFPAPGLE